MRDERSRLAPNNLFEKWRFPDPPAVRAGWRGLSGRHQKYARPAFCLWRPYILNLYEIPIRQCHNDNDAANAAKKVGQEFLLQVTTRSVMG